VNSWIDLHALWQILVVGLLAGAGLPALFAVGLRALSLPGHGAAPIAADSDRVIGGSRPGVAAAVLCFAVVLAGVGYGIYIVVNGS
jgi:hypothetical protein